LGNLLFENDPQYFFHITTVTPACDAGQRVGGGAKALCSDHNIDLVGLVWCIFTGSGCICRGFGNGRQEGGKVAETFGEKKTLTLGCA
jgi:hypothetical protein